MKLARIGKLDQKHLSWYEKLEILDPASLDPECFQAHLDYLKADKEEGARVMFRILIATPKIKKHAQKLGLI